MFGVLLSACSSGKPSGNQAGYQHISSTPLNVTKIYAQESNLILFSGSAKGLEEPVSDGRLYLLNRTSGAVRLLTTPEAFGEAFFAAGGAIAPDGTRIYTKVNTDVGQGLYAIELQGGKPELLTTTAHLNLSDILEDTFVLSPDGQTLAFSAYGQSKGPTQLLGVYTLNLAAPQKPEGLKLVQEEELGQAGIGQVLTPHFNASGKLVVDVIRRPANPQPEKLGPTLTPDELKQLSPEELEDLKLKPLGTSVLGLQAAPVLRVPHNGWRHITQGYNTANHSGSIRYVLDFNLSGSSDCGTYNRAAKEGFGSQDTMLAILI